MYLLDTCTLLWWLAFEDRLPKGVREVLAAGESPVHVSVVSIWEILVKHARGKIRIHSGDQPAFDFIKQTVSDTGFAMIPLLPDDIRHLSALPALHRDPFDRMLICQTIERGMTLVTPDPNIRRYPIRTLWH
jgi:PIN domain nuclease of toxin-antitoxin system